MDKLQRKISYIEGLMEGMDIHAASKEGKILPELVELSKMICNQLEQLRHQLEEQESYLEAVDEDLAELEEILFEDDLEVDEEDEDDPVVTKHVMNINERSGELHYRAP